MGSGEKPGIRRRLRREVGETMRLQDRYRKPGEEEAEREVSRAGESV